MWKCILQLPPLSVTECFTGRAFQSLDPTPETRITYPPPTPKESYGSRQSQHKSSRFSSSGNKGMIDSPNDSDEFSEEVIYSQESPKMVDIITDFDWDSGRFVEFKSPFTRNEILSPGNNSSRWNKNNSSVMMIDNHQRRNEINSN